MSLEALLAAGGDERLHRNPASGQNKYGCGPRPEPDTLDFASSTASLISPHAYQAAASLYERVGPTLDAPGYARELARIRTELLALWGLEGQGVELVFTSSGTDAHLLAGQLAAAQVAVMVEEAETGSGVRLALAGRHFAAFARGHAVARGELAGGAGLEVEQVGLRQPGGQPRALEELQAQFEARVAAAVQAGNTVLAVGVDVSKTGMVAPGSACLAGLVARYPGRVEGLIDACQGRLAPATLCHYLAQGLMVALTGSKFLAGPSFSGALLLPPGLAARLRDQQAPTAFAAYSRQAEWPTGWRLSHALPDQPEPGLLLRWEAALAELRRFSAVPASRLEAGLASWGRLVSERLAASALLEPLPTPRLTLDRPTPGWDGLPTIFPFRLRHPDGTPMDAATTAHIYRELQQASPRVLLGQPVALGNGTTALRLCASARHLVACSEPAGLEAAGQAALKALALAASLAASASAAT